jgi:hypothetical protein
LIFTIPLESFKLGLGENPRLCAFGDFGIGERSTFCYYYFLKVSPLIKIFFDFDFEDFLFGVGFSFLLELGSVRILLYGDE